MNIILKYGYQGQHTTISEAWDQPYKWSILECELELIKLEYVLTTIKTAVNELQNNQV